MSSLSTKQETKKSDFLTIGILVVDDEVMQAKITMHCLAEAGYSNVICVHSGRDALQILQETREMVQLVLIDVGMPEMDGYALLKAIRSMVSDGPDIPVIMLSSTEDLNIVYSCLVSGADDYMLKPVQPEFVKNIWSKVWKRRMEKQKLAEIDAEREKMVSTVSRLETEVEQLRDRVNEAIETPIHVIIRTLNDIIENKSLTNEVKDALSSIITKLGSSNLYKPAFARILDDSDDDETTTTPTKVVSIPDAASSTTDDPVQTTSNSSSSSNLSALPTDVGARKRQIALQTQAWLRAEISKSISSSYGDLPGASYINFSNTDPTVLSQHDRSGSDGASLIHAAAKGGYAYSLVDNVAEYVPCRSHSDPVLAKNIPSSSSSSSSSSVSDDGAVANQPQNEKPTFATPSYLRHANVAKETAELLCSWKFNVWLYEEKELITYFATFLENFGLIKQFQIPLDKLFEFLCRVQKMYCRKNPYHNFRHAFDVAHFNYLLLTLGKAAELLTPLEILALLIGSLCHDIGHVGTSNAFQVAIRSPLALIYNDLSPLENYHASETVKLLAVPECNIFENLSVDQQKEMRRLLVDMILATDLARFHVEICAKFDSVRSTGFSKDKKEHRNLLLQIMIKSADISNPCRPFHISKYWSYMVQEEFFAQGDKERKLDLPISPMMDRYTVKIPETQMSFINFVAKPLFLSLSDLLPSLVCLVQQTELNAKTWKRILESDADEKNIPLFLSNRVLDGPIPDSKQFDNDDNNDNE
mmetsp:Transcript_11255/g.16890  ORF Transcript_11255/g.16890 Transcript_11255/m.16890 type:complete len:758 (-) Transcript_11255:37-2310(-)